MILQNHHKIESISLSALRRFFLIVLISAAVVAPASAVTEIAEEEKVEEVSVFSQVKPGLSPNLNTAEESIFIPPEIEKVVVHKEEDRSSSTLYILLCELILYD